MENEVKKVKHFKRVNHYTVYENGKEVYDGSLRQVAEKYNRSTTYILDACHYDTYMNSKYKVKQTGTFVTEIKYDAPIKRKKPEVYSDLEKDPFEFLLWHLKYKGNTSVVFDPEPYLPRLKEMGFTCKVEKTLDVIDKKRVTKRGRPKKKKYNYLVEVVNANRGSTGLQV